jgi:hypothetical protein
MIAASTAVFKSFISLIFSENRKKALAVKKYYRKQKAEGRWQNAEAESREAEW